MLDFTKRTPTISEDGSTTFRIDGSDEHFHSVHGAYNESMHIYINTGLQALKDRENIAILEVGFGTGLNALLTLAHQEGREIHYHAIEAYPLNMDEVKLLNYTNLIDDTWGQSFLEMHTLLSGEEVEIYPKFFFRKTIQKLEEALLRPNYFDLVYFDAFSPDLQPELWSEEIFQKVWLAMNNKSILTTYCAKGWVKRAMKKVGFTVEGLPGPAGKREISKAVKI